MGAVIRATSSFYHTPAFPAESGPDFVNAAVFVTAEWDAFEMLTKLHQIEADMGRIREKRWGQRTLDLDLIASADVVLPDVETHRFWRTLPLEDQLKKTPAQLILPHPRLQDRAFVIVPLAEIAPDWVHPVLDLSILQMLEALPQEDRDAVRRIP